MLLLTQRKPPFVSYRHAVVPVPPVVSRCISCGNLIVVVCEVCAEEHKFRVAEAVASATRDTTAAEEAQAKAEGDVEDLAAALEALESHVALLETQLREASSAPSQQTSQQMPPGASSFVPPQQTHAGAFSSSAPPQQTYPGASSSVPPQQTHADAFPTSAPPKQTPPGASFFAAPPQHTPPGASFAPSPPPQTPAGVYSSALLRQPHAVHPPRLHRHHRRPQVRLPLHHCRRRPQVHLLLHCHSRSLQVPPPPPLHHCRGRTQVPPPLRRRSRCPRVPQNLVF